MILKSGHHVGEYWCIHLICCRLFRKSKNKLCKSIPSFWMLLNFDTSFTPFETILLNCIYSGSKRLERAFLAFAFQITWMWHKQNCHSIWYLCFWTLECVQDSIFNTTQMIRKNIPFKKLKFESFRKIYYQVFSSFILKSNTSTFPSNYSNSF